MALIAVDSVTVGLVLADAGVRAEGGGDREVPGELGDEPGVDRRVIGHVSEPNPCVQLGWSDRGVRIAGVGVVDDA